MWSCRRDINTCNSTETIATPLSYADSHGVCVLAVVERVVGLCIVWERSNPRGVCLLKHKGKASSFIDSSCCH